MDSVYKQKSFPLFSLPMHWFLCTSLQINKVSIQAIMNQCEKKLFSWSVKEKGKCLAFILLQLLFFFVLIWNRNAFFIIFQLLHIIFLAMTLKWERWEKKKKQKQHCFPPSNHINCVLRRVLNLSFLYERQAH